MGKYKDKIEAEHRRMDMSALQIRTQKCQRCHVRNEERKRERIERDEKMYADWRALTFEEQLDKLERENPEGANKQKTKIRKRLEERKN